MKKLFGILFILKSKLYELKKISLQIHQLLLTKVEKEKEKYGVDIEFKLVKAGTEIKLMIKQVRLLY